MYKLLAAVVLALSSVAVQAATCNATETLLVSAERDNSALLMLCYETKTSVPIYRYFKEGKLVKEVRHSPADLTLINESNDLGKVVGYHLKAGGPELMWLQIKQPTKETISEIQYWMGGQLMAADEIPARKFKVVINTAVPLEQLKP